MPATGKKQCSRNDFRIFQKNKH